MDNKNYIIVGLIAALIVSVIFWVLRPDRTLQQVIERGSQSQSVGALSGPDIISPYVRWGDVAIYNARTTMNQTTPGQAGNGSTTPCALQSPSATSTLIGGSFQVSTPTSTAATLTIAKAATAFATTTVLADNVSLAANAQITLLASTTGQNGNPSDTRVIFGPNQWIVFGAKGAPGAAGLAGFQFGGACTARWQVTD